MTLLQATPSAPHLSAGGSSLSRWSQAYFRPVHSEEAFQPERGLVDSGAWRVSWDLSNSKPEAFAAVTDWNGVNPPPSIALRSNVDGPLPPGLVVDNSGERVVTMDVGRSHRVRSFSRGFFGMLPAGSYAEVISIKEGTLSKELYGFLDTLDGKSPGDATQNIWSDFSERVRNPDLFTGSVDISGLVAAYQASGAWGGYGNGGCAITRRHCLFASHFAPSSGTNLCFVSMAGEKVMRSIVSTVDLGSDIRIATLDTDLPLSINPVKLMPADFIRRLSSGLHPLITANRFLGQAPNFISRAPRLAVVAFLAVRAGQLPGWSEDNCIATNIWGNDGAYYYASRNVGAADLVTVSGRTMHTSWRRFLQPFKDWQPLDTLAGPAKGYGDSGSPNFVVVNGEPVLLWLSFASTSGASLHSHISLVQTGIAESAHPQHQPALCDLSMYPLLDR